MRVTVGWRGRDHGRWCRSCDFENCVLRTQEPVQIGQRVRRDIDGLKKCSARAWPSAARLSRYSLRRRNTWLLRPRLYPRAHPEWRRRWRRRAPDWDRFCASGVSVLLGWASRRPCAKQHHSELGLNEAHAGSRHCFFPCGAGRGTAGWRGGGRGVNERTFDLRARLARGIISAPALAFGAHGFQTLINREIAGLGRPSIGRADHQATGRWRRSVLRLLFEQRDRLGHGFQTLLRIRKRRNLRDAGF